MSDGNSDGNRCVIIFPMSLRMLGVVGAIALELGWIELVVAPVVDNEAAGREARGPAIAASRAEPPRPLEDPGREVGRQEPREPASDLAPVGIGREGAGRLAELRAGADRVEETQAR